MAAAQLYKVDPTGGTTTTTVKTYYAPSPTTTTVKTYYAPAPTTTIYYAPAPTTTTTITGPGVLDITIGTPTITLQEGTTTTTTTGLPPVTVSTAPEIELAPSDTTTTTTTGMPTVSTMPEYEVVPTEPEVFTPPTDTTTTTIVMEVEEPFEIYEPEPGEMEIPTLPEGPPPVIVPLIGPLPPPQPMTGGGYTLYPYTVSGGGGRLTGNPIELFDIKCTPFAGRMTGDGYVLYVDGVGVFFPEEEVISPPPIMIERWTDDDVKIYWPDDPDPDIYYLVGDGQGRYTDDYVGWGFQHPWKLAQHGVDGIEFYHDDNYILHTSQFGKGEPEVYYKAYPAGVDPGVGPDNLTVFSTAPAVGKVDYTLEPGYNLVSLSILPVAADLDILIGTQLEEGDSQTADVIFGDIGGWKQAFLNDATHQWQGSLTAYGMDADKGYWIRNRTGAAELMTILGNVPATDRRLTVNPGWNLVGTTFPRHVAFDQAQIASGYGGPLKGGNSQTADRIFADISGWKQCYLSSDNRTFIGSLMDVNNLGLDAGSFSPRRGYWIHVRQSGGPWDYPKPY